MGFNYLDFTRWLEEPLDSGAKQYEHVRRVLTAYFAWRGGDDPENLVDETITRVLEQLRKGVEIRAEEPMRFVYGVAGYVLLEHLRERQRAQTLAINLIQLIELTTTIEDEGCLEECWRKLPPDECQLLEQRYLEEEPNSRTVTQDLASARGVTPNAVRVRVCRIKQQLKACYDDCREQKSAR